MKKAFTLIEMSIVLVIIGFIVGGILVGQSLIDAATIRAEISQIEKYNQAVNTFRTKYGELPGDLDAPSAATFGFVARGTSPGQGDGNGIIGGYLPTYGGGSFVGSAQSGEATLFWEDLSAANLIEGSFTNATASSTNIIPFNNINLAGVAKDYPAAKLGQGNYVTVWSLAGINYFSVLIIQSSHLDYGGQDIFPPTGSTNYGPTVRQAYAIDSKVDDGLPQSGNVRGLSPQDTGAQWSGTSTYSSSPTPSTTATSGTSTTCFDNGGVSGPMNYSIAQNNGSGVNCPLSFRFQ